MQRMRLVHPSSGSLSPIMFWSTLHSRYSYVTDP